MKKMLIRSGAVFILIAAVFVVMLCLPGQRSGNRIDGIIGDMAVVVNEIRNGDESAQARYDELTKQLKFEARGRYFLALAMGMSLGACAVFFLYIFLAVLRPFHKMERFSRDIAAGEYDRPLDMPRHNVFGAFSWAFDSMREGLHMARQAEQEAKEANKTLIAVLSHDIRAPVASIRACAEALSMGQGSNEERRRRYLDTIVRGSDEVARLSDDLFLHTISDMNKLVIEPVALPLRPFITEFTSFMDVVPVAEIPDVNVVADGKRLREIFGNVVQNAEKYAPDAPVELSFAWEDGLLYCVFSDRGTSLSPEDAPFIFHKFYRGKNAANEKGSGLGLYIVRHIAEAMGGRVLARCSEDGLKILIGLRQLTIDN